MNTDVSAAHRYLRAIHWRDATVYYVEDGERRSILNMRFFHTQGWSDHDVIAEIQRRHPTWSEIELGLQSTFTPAWDAIIPTRNLTLEAELLDQA